MPEKRNHKVKNNNCLIDAYHIYTVGIKNYYGITLWGERERGSMVGTGISSHRKY